MKDGYYWARWIDDKDANWQPLFVFNDIAYTFGCEASCAVAENRIEFGDRIENEKYEK